MSCVKKMRKRHAVRKMKEGPSEPSCRHHREAIAAMDSFTVSQRDPKSQRALDCTATVPNLGMIRKGRVLRVTRGKSTELRLYGTRFLREGR